jgi:hypothetical protein
LAFSVLPLRRWRMCFLRVNVAIFFHSGQ